MEDRRECSDKKSFHGVATGRDGCTMVPFSRSKRKSRIEVFTMRTFSRLFCSVVLVLSLMTGMTNVAAQSCTNPPANMVGWWTGDGNAVDLAGPNNGKLINGATFATGYVGKAFALNGSTQYVDVKNASRINVSASDFTVDAWVDFNSLGEPDQSLVDKMNSNGTNSDGWRLIYQGDYRQFWFCLGGGSGVNGCVEGSSTTVYSSTNPQAQVWYHVTGVKTSSQISIYVNGTLENTTSLGSFTDTNSTDLLFGTTVITNGKTAWLNGLVDEVELFNRALSATEIAAIYNAGHTGKCKVEVALTPGKLTFASQTVGTTSPPQPVTLKNKSPNGGVLNIASIVTTGDFGRTHDCPPSLNPGQQCTIEVSFTPTATGTRTGRLLVTDNTPNGVPQKVLLTGTGQ